jgi:hypothetical protein
VRLLVLLLLLLQVLYLLLVPLRHLLRLLLVLLFDLLHPCVVRPLLFQPLVILFLLLLESHVILLLLRVQLFLLLLVLPVPVRVARVGWRRPRMSRQLVGMNRAVHLPAGISRLGRPVVMSSLLGGHSFMA